LLLPAAADHRWGDFRAALVGAVIGLGMLLAIHLVNPRGMGMGDVKLAGVEGLYLGFLGLRHVLFGLFLGFMLGSVGGILLIATRIRSRKDHIPFAPFLAAGALLAVFVGQGFLDWYGH
jgi:leader peptidase (prepilin peptidase)/N-methyltransferase